jgi:hypothetical protein
MSSFEPNGDRMDAFELLELDIDLRLADLWRCADEQQRDWTLELVAVYMRAAYGKGYCDALAETERGQLCSEHGYGIPQPRSEDAGSGRFGSLSPRLLERFAD